jgi:hypothetical protein
MTQDELDKFATNLIKLLIPKGSSIQTWIKGFSIYIDGELVMGEEDKLYHLTIVRKSEND